MKNKVLALVMTMVMLVAMIPFAQTSVYADGTLTEATLLTDKNEVVKSYDTDAELRTINTYGDGTFAISNGVLTLTGNGSEDFVYSAISSFSNESMLHIKINGVTNATHTHPILYLHDRNNSFCTISFQNQAINFGGTAYSVVNTSQPFEIVIKKIANGSVISYEVYARQNASDNFTYLGGVNTIAGWVNENRFEFYSSGGNSIAIDYVKVYNPKSVNALPKVNAAFASGDYALVKQLILTDYAVCFDITTETMADYNALLDKDSVFTSMTGAPYAELSAVALAFSAAVAERKAWETENTKSFDELIGTTGAIEVVTKIDTDAELRTISTYGDGNVAISDGVLTLTGNGSEDFVYSSISSFSNESMLHIKINGVTNATHTHPILYLHDNNNPFCTISFQNQAINFGGAAYSAVNASQPFELVMKKIDNNSVVSYEVYARQNSSDNFTYLGSVNTTAGWVNENRIEFYASGGNSVAIDYIKVYNQIRASFEELVYSENQAALFENPISLDSEAEFEAIGGYNADAMSAANGILTMPTENAEVYLNNKHNGFPIDSALTFKVDGFSGANTNVENRPSVVLYWLDSTGPDVGYCIELKFRDVAGKPMLHFGETPIKMSGIDTTQAFEILAKRIGTQDIEIWARQSSGSDAIYTKYSTQIAVELTHMNQVTISSGNGQSIRIDNINLYFNNEPAIVDAVKNYLSQKDYNGVKQYQNHLGITDEVWAEFDALKDKDAVYNADYSYATTVAEIRATFIQAIIDTPEITWGFDSILDMYYWTNETSQNGWNIKNGALKSKVNYNEGEGYYNVWRKVSYTDDFVFEAKMRYNSVNSMFLFLFNTSKSNIMILKERDLWGTSTKEGVLYDPANNIKRGEWFVFKLETYNNGERARYYINDELVRDFLVNKGQSSLYSDEIILVQNSTEHYVLDSEVEIDYMNFNFIENNINVSGIRNGAEFLESDIIGIESAFANEVNAEEIEYLINGVVVAKGVAPNYKAAISGLPAGNYELKARSGIETSVPIDFVIKKTLSGTVIVEKNGTNGVTLTTELTDKLNQIYEIEYLIDGVSVGSSQKTDSFPVIVSELSNVQHTVTAVCKGINGNIIEKLSNTVMLDLTNGEVSENYSNEISYSVSGTAGDAVYEYNNGSHKLNLRHESDKLVYLTNEGEETYRFGTGDFVILTNGPYADVFRNGQFAFSAILPRTEAVSTNITQNGLVIENEKISVPENRKNYFIRKNISTRQPVYAVSGLPHVYNLDFVAGKNDNVRFIVNDGYYRTDMSIRDGKIYAWNCLKNKSIPSEKYLCDVPSVDGDIYFRLETSSGISRLYADGKWIATFRDARTAGGKNISIDISKGSNLKFVALQDASDVYVFNDLFDNSGEYPSREYWKDGDSLDIDDSKGITLNSSNGNEARSELNVYAGDFELSGSVTLENLNSGFWFIADHCVTDVYTKIGYNKENGRFEAFDYINGAVSNMQTENGTLPVNRKIDFKLKVRQLDDKKEMTLFVDGTPVLTYKKERFMRGTVGFAINDGIGYIHSVDYRGDARVIRTGYVFVHSQHISVPTHDVLEKGDEITLVASEGARLKSNDNGKTWTVSDRVENDNHEILQFRDENGNVTNEAICVKYEQTGTFDEDGLSINNVALYRSFDYGETWTFEQNINSEPEATLFTMYCRLQEGLSGRIYIPVAGGKNESEGFVDIYYSDDKGKTWTKSNRVDSNELGYYVQEPCILEMADGTVRMYSRTNLGIINYFVSYDGGKTFEDQMYTTPFLSAANCFNIQRDPYDTKTIYMFWSYDNANLSTTEQFPRTRWALARSTDECETWEFLGTIHENITPGANESQNLNLCIIKDHIILNCWSDDTYEPISQPGRIITIEKDRLQGTKKFESVHLVANNDIENTATISKDSRDDMLIIHPESGNVISRGEMYAGMAQSEYVCADVAANYIQARAIYEENGSVTLKMGITSIRFERSMVVDKDGKRYIPIATFAQKFNLKTVEDNGVIIISKYDKWTDVQKYTARYAVDLVLNETDEAEIVSEFNEKLSASEYDGVATHLEYYADVYNISTETKTAFASLKYPNDVYETMKNVSYTTCAEVKEAYTNAVNEQKSYEALHSGTIIMTPKITKTGENFVGSVYFENHLEDKRTKDVIVILALYDANDKLLDRPTVASLNITAGYRDTFKLPDVADNSNVKYAKIFVWEGTNLSTSYLQPLCNFEEYIK